MNNQITFFARGAKCGWPFGVVEFPASFAVLSFASIDCKAIPPRPVADCRNDLRCCRAAECSVVCLVLFMGCSGVLSSVEVSAYDRLADGNEVVVVQDCLHES